MTRDPSALARQVSARYPTRFSRHYTYWKIVTDPAYAAVARLLRDAAALPIIDLGCGMGQLAFHLRENGITTPIHGLDIDAKKIAIASRIAPDFPPPPAFEAGDLRHLNVAMRGHVTLLDVLQYLPETEQRDLMSRAADLVDGSEGLFVIRTCLKDESWHYRLTHATDVFARAIRWMGTPPLKYPTRAFISQIIEEHGMSAEFTPLWGRTPFNNYLIVGRRTPA